MSGYRKVLYHVDQGIARLSLNRPEKRNALDDELIAEVKDALSRSEADTQVRVVLLTGEGRDFCSGADLAALQRSETATVMETRADVQATEEMLLQHARAGLAGFKVPKQIFILSEFPKTASGKILKRDLKAALA